MVTPATTGRVTARHDLISSGSLQPQQLQIKVNIGTKLLLLWQVAHEAERSVTSSEHHSSVTRSELHASSCVGVGRKEFKQPSSCERIEDPWVRLKTKFSLRYPCHVCSVHVGFRHFTGEFTILENMSTYQPYVQINIKRCHSDGCDTRIRGIKTLGYKYVQPTLNS